MRVLVTFIVALGVIIGAVAAQDGPVAAKPANPHLAMMQAAFRITGAGDNPRKRITGTGFLVERRGSAPTNRVDYIAVTAAHVLRDISGNTATFLIRVMREDGSFQRLFLPVPIRQKGAQLWTELPTVDVAVMYLPLSKAAVQPVPFDALATDSDVDTLLALNVGDSVHVLGYPFGYEFNELPAVRSAVLASYPLVPARGVKRLIVDFMAFGGDSGGPLYTSSATTGQSGHTLKVLGVVTHQILSPDNVENTGLASVTPAEFIREAIRLLPQLPGD